MPFNLNIPQISGQPLDVTIDVGQTIFVLGANGTGKSALMFALQRQHQQNSRRISAQRQNWLEGNAINMSPQERQNLTGNILGQDHQPQSRWMEVYSAQRTTIAVYDLVDAENVRARNITKAVDDGNIALATELAKKDAPIKVINELLRLSSIPIIISVLQNQNVVASKNGSAPYSIAQLSDGERNALLIAANILTVNPGMLILIDEPERHLHRSIISPLLSLLISQRKDCAFVVSTHDVLLPADNPSARTLLIRGCAHNNDIVTAWDADLVPSDSELDEAIKIEILGARRKILFVEGDEQSLDKPLYSLVFPSVSVIAKESCREIEHTVAAIRAANNLHWVHAFGVVDNDGRPAAEITELMAKGVYALPVFSVESIYYHPELQRRVAERHAAVTGANPATLVADAKAAAITAVTPHVNRLSERVAEKSVREEVFRHLPKREDIIAGTSINIGINVSDFVAQERGKLQNAIASADLSAIIARYPVRETPALDRIAQNLGFQNCAQYERAIQKMLMDDDDALSFVRSQFGTLAADIAAA